MAQLSELQTTFLTSCLVSDKKSQVFSFLVSNLLTGESHAATRAEIVEELARRPDGKQWLEHRKLIAPNSLEAQPIPAHSGVPNPRTFGRKK